MVVVIAHLVRDGLGERVLLWVEPSPRRGHGIQEPGAVGVGREEAGVGGVLRRGAEDVLQQHRPRGEPAGFWHAEGANLLAEALQDLRLGRPFRAKVHVVASS
jgi:hypothetical protein